MSKGIKIFVGVVVFLGVLSGIFLLTAKKKPAATTASQNSPTKQVAATQKTPTAPSVNSSPTAPAVKTEKSATPQAVTKDKNAIMIETWEQCKNKTIAADKSLFWNVQIFEGIPAGGTYAKGNLNNNATYPVRVIIKSDSQIVEKIKGMLTPGKSALLRGTCAGVADDGAVILQAF